MRRSEAAVVIAAPEAYSDGNGVFIRWRTETETSNLGFYVYRIEKGGNQIVDNKFITGSAIKYRDQTVMGEEYKLFDPDGTAMTQYFVESYERNGRRTVTDPFFPQFVADLATIAGSSSSSLCQTRLQATGKISSGNLTYDRELQSAIDENSLVADPVTQRWVAAQPGAKFGVRRTGMYRVTRTQLQAAGFDVNSDPNLWQMYTDGVEQAIIVEQSGNYVDFYAKGIDTVESDTRLYYLVVGPQAGKRISTVGLRPSFGTVKAVSYDQSVVFKERNNYLLDVFNGDGENYFGHLYGSFLTSVNVDLSSIDTASAIRSDQGPFSWILRNTAFCKRLYQWASRRSSHGKRPYAVRQSRCYGSNIVSGGRLEHDRHDNDQSQRLWVL